MSWLAWIVIGLIAGALAKLIMPGRDPGGFLVTIVIGILGGLVGGFVGGQIGIGSVSGFNLATILTATGGAVTLLVVFRMVRR
ncbi:MAG: GlsB/YeaQ/YmgE family stress response membrane protein [Alphaproteobacteria bacterium]